MMTRSRRSRWCAGVALALAAHLGIPGVAAPAGRDVVASALPGGADALREAYGEWQVVCVTRTPADAPGGAADAPGAAPRRCVMAQNQADGKTRQRVLSAELQVAPGGKLTGLLVLPFGLALDAGVKLQIDDGPSVTPARFTTCLPVGCMVPVTFDAATLANLKKGAALTIAAEASGSAQRVTLALSLKGFPAALTRLADLAK